MTTGTKDRTPLVGDQIGLLKEAGKALFNEDGTVDICIATPGWGSSGYYSEDLLKSDGVAVFIEGIQSYWDHATLREEYERPERSLRDLAGALAENAAWSDQGFNGPGLYSKVQPFSEYKEKIEEMAPHIGMSMVVYGTSHIGTAEGESGDIIDSFVAARSVDFVTLPGRGGAVKAKFESYRGGGPRSGKPRKESDKNDDKKGETKFFITEAKDLSHDAIREMIYDALQDKYNPNRDGSYAWPREVYDEYVIFAHDGKTWKANYVIDNTGTETVCNLGDATEVVAVWEPLNESEEVQVNDKEERELREAKAEADRKLQTLTEALNEEKTKREAAEATNKKLLDRIVEHDADKVVREALGKIDGMPEATTDRLAKEIVAKTPKTESGEIDKDKLTTLVVETVKEHAEYLKSLGLGGGVKNLGESKESGDLASLFGGNGDGDSAMSEDEEKQLKERLSKSFQGIGLKESAAKIATEGR